MTNLLKIKLLAKKKQISLKSLAEQAEISEQGLHKMLRQNSTSTDTLEKIAAILGVSPVEFFGDGQSEVVELSPSQEISDEAVVESAPVQTIYKNEGQAAGRDMTVNPPCTFAVSQVLDEIAAQRKLVEEAQAQNRKSQEQIDRLLTLLENAKK